MCVCAFAETIVKRAIFFKHCIWLGVHAKETLNCHLSYSQCCCLPCPFSVFAELFHIPLSKTFFSYCRSRVDKLQKLARFCLSPIFCMTCKLRKYFKELGKKSKEESYVMAWKLYEIQILVSLTKIVLELSYTHSSICHLW